MTRVKTLSLIMAATMAAISVVFALSADASRQAHSSASARAAQARATIRHSFALFRRPARPGDRLVARGRSAAPRASADEMSATWRLAYAGPAGKLYAYIAGNDLCVLYQFGSDTADPGATGGCAHASDAAKLGPGIVMPGPTTRVVSLLPDDARVVTVYRADGGQQKLPVVNNAFVYSGSAMRQWQFATESGGTQVERVPDYEQLQRQEEHALGHRLKQG